MIDESTGIRDADTPMATGGSKYRRDIDGLRAVAVLSVIAFHAFPNRLAGGYVGVDVFFVISGFLISTIILGNLERGTFSFFDFYSRRIRRIFPALLLVLTATYAFGWLALFDHEFKQLGKHVAGGAGFVSNLVLWGESGYFDVAADEKVLLHLWSLGIEEQFYFIWPLLAWIAWKRQVGFFGLIASICAVSFTLNLAQVRSRPVAAFYSPQTRFWELMIGSMLAYATLHGEATAARFQRTMSGFPGGSALFALARTHAGVLRESRGVLGALLIATATLLLNKTSPFPGWWALLPTVGTALIISAGAEAWLNRVVLSTRVMVWVGLISYPLYLWHWPLLSYARIIEGQTPRLSVRIVAVVAATALAWLTYRVIERPLREGGLPTAKALGLFALVAACGGVGYVTYLKEGLPSRTAGQSPAVSLNWPDDQKSVPPCLSEFPELAKVRDTAYCLVSKGAEPTVALIGDSHANHFYPGLAQEYAELGVGIVHLGGNACPPMVGITSRYSGREDWCKGTNTFTVNYVARAPRIETVILAANWHLYLAGARHRPDGPPWEIRSIARPELRDNFEVFEAQMRDTLAILEKSGKRVVVIKQIPELDFIPSRCLSRPFRPAYAEADCRFPRATSRTYLEGYEKFFDRFFRDYPQVAIWDPSEYLCDEQFCYATRDRKLMYRDRVHLTTLGSAYVASKLKLY